jgi:class 3 adenylate cyclase/tetratricopeptide (TPR) repeat protein
MGTETVAVLFTDLVDSTGLIGRIGEEGAESVRREHFAQLRAAVAQFGGREVKNIGDGLMVVLPSSSRAISAAVTMQQQVYDWNRGHAVPLGLRVGVAVGEADTDEDDYFGLPVVEAARLCDIAASGEILVTEVARVFAGSRGGHAFNPRGLVSLKGLDHPTAVAAVRWEPAPRPGEFELPLPARLQVSRSSVFVGRAEEHARLLDRMKVAEDGTVQVALVSGEPGIGKTSFLSGVGAAVHEQGAKVLYGRCEEDLASPYQPWTEALRQVVLYAPDALLAEVKPGLDRVVPELRQRRPDLPELPRGDPDADRYVFYAAVVDLLHRLSSERAVVIILDDLHWADLRTIQLLRHLATVATRLRVLVIGTFREAEADASPLADALAAFHRNNGVDRMALRGLSDEELLEFMERLAGQEMDSTGIRLRDALFAETDGNPFFVAEVLRHLVETGAIARGHSGQWEATDWLAGPGLPVSIREVIGRRVSHLGTDGAHLLAAAAVMGREFDLVDVAPLADLPETSALDALERAATAGLLDEVGPGRFSFAHAMIAHALYHQMGATRRARLHLRAAEQLEGAAATQPQERMLELARHWSEAMVPDAAAKTAGYAGQAGELSLARLAPEQARTWFERGLEHLDRSRTDDPELRCALRVGLGDALQQLGDPAARDTLLDAAHRAGELGQVALLARAALATSRRFSSVGGADPRVIEVLRLALERVSAEEHGTRALLLAVLSTEQLYDEPMAVRRRAIDEAIAEARASGDDGVLVRVLNLVYPGMWCPSTIDERMALSAEAVALAVELGDEVEEFWARLYLVSGTSERGTWLTEEADRYHDIAARIGQPMMRWVDSWAVFNEASLRADPAAAEAAAEAGLAIGMESGQPDASAIYGSQIVLLSAMRGDRAELVPLLAPVADQMERTPIFWAWLAMSLLEAGDRGQAHEVLDDQLPLLPAEPDGLSWLATCVAWAEAAARLSDVPAAEVLIARLEPHRDLIAYSGTTHQGSVAEAIGRLRSLTGDHSGALAAFDTADALHERLQAPYFQARSWAFRAEALIWRGGPGDQDAADRLLHHAGQVAEELGLGGVTLEVDRVRELLNR